PRPSDDSGPVPPAPAPGSWPRRARRALPRAPPMRSLRASRAQGQPASPQRPHSTGGACALPALAHEAVALAADGLDVVGGAHHLAELAAQVAHMRPHEGACPGRVAVLPDIDEKRARMHDFAL